MEHKSKKATPHVATYSPITQMISEISGAGSNRTIQEALLKNPKFKDKVEVIDAKKVKINIGNFNAWAFARLFHNFSAPQQRALSDVLNKLKSEGRKYDLPSLIEEVRADESIKANIKDNTEKLKSMLSEPEPLPLTPLPKNG